MKILIEAMHGLGDTVCILPTIRAIKLTYPNAQLTILVKYNINKQIIEASDIEYSKLISLNPYSKNIIYTIQKLWYLRTQRFDLAVCCANTPVRKARFFMRLINPKKVLGLQFDNGIYYNNLRDKFHFVDANLMAIKEIVDINKVDKSPRLYIEDNNYHYMLSRMTIDKSKIVLGLCIGDGDVSYRNRWLRSNPVFTRGWGIKNMIALIEILIEHGYQVVLIGGRLEERLIPYIPKYILNSSSVQNFINKTSLKESMSLASLCDAVIGVDTGMMHISDALGVRTLSIFGPTNPKTHGAYSQKARFIEYECDCKYCYGSISYTSCKDRKCLNNVTPARVFSRIEDLNVYK